MYCCVVGDNADVAVSCDTYSLVDNAYELGTHTNLWLDFF